MTERQMVLGMVLQNIVFPADWPAGRELYIRSVDRLNQSGRFCEIRQGEMIGTDTYMNAFDIRAWKNYTNIKDLSLICRVRGKGVLRIYWEKENVKAVCIAEISAKNPSEGLEEFRYRFRDFHQMTEGILYFNFRAETDACLEAWFETESPAEKDIKISVVICTYRRKEQLEQLIHVIQGKNPMELPKGWLHTLVIDNGSELEDGYGEGITVYHNPNTGGSGGFARGMRETVKNLPEFQATHIVLMDDDVILQMESILRLRALLSCIRVEYDKEVIAGRMFRLDRPQVQYTAVEIWNGGDIRHIGWNQDMTDRQCLWSMNDNQGGEYSGWWFACFPIEFVKENEPLPFFLHCDDVEYGLRHGGTPVILNGIQVWHETYEYRSIPAMAYYDYRNSLIVNYLHGRGETDRGRIWEQFWEKITDAHVREDYLLEYYLICAFGDYLKGRRWFLHKNDRKIHRSLLKRRKGNRYENSLRWRGLKMLFFLDRDRCGHNGE